MRERKTRPPLLAARHWATAALVVVGLAAVLVREIVEAKALEDLIACLASLK